MARAAFKMSLTIEMGDGAIFDVGTPVASIRVAEKRHGLQIVAERREPTPEEEAAWLNSEFAAHAGF